MYMIIDIIRERIKKCRKSRYRIWRESGVSEAQLCRIMKGKTVTLETGEKLLRYFGYELRKKKGAVKK